MQGRAFTLSELLIVRVGLYPAITPTAPIQLALQMRTQPIHMDVTDGVRVWTGALLEDARVAGSASGAADSPARVKVYRWDPERAEWELFDPAPTMEVKENCWIAHTQIIQPPLRQYSSDFYGAAIERTATASRHWFLYP